MAKQPLPVALLAVPLLIGAAAAPARPPAATKIHIGDIDDETIREENTNNRIRIKIGFRVHDADHKAVSHARVRADWSGALFGQVTCDTDPEGYCSATSKLIANETGLQINVTIKTVEGPELEYDKAANHDPDRDSDGSQLKIIR